jgi:hypothetical protein
MSHILFAEQLYPHAQCEKSQPTIHSIMSSSIIKFVEDRETICIRIHQYVDRDKNARVLKIPVYGLVDADAYGLTILDKLYYGRGIRYNRMDAGKKLPRPTSAETSAV